MYVLPPSAAATVAAAAVAAAITALVKVQLLSCRALLTLVPCVDVWSQAYTNITAHAGGAVFCTFSTPNLAFWHSLGVVTGATPIPFPSNDQNRTLENGKVYIMFETNEGKRAHVCSNMLRGNRHTAYVHHEGKTLNRLLIFAPTHSLHPRRRYAKDRD